MALQMCSSLKYQIANWCFPKWSKNLSLGIQFPSKIGYKRFFSKKRGSKTAWMA